VPDGPLDGRLDVLITELRSAAGDDERLVEIYERLSADVGSDAAGRLWWRAFGASDATHT
jgi:hypothetical protein